MSAMLEKIQGYLLSSEASPAQIGLGVAATAVSCSMLYSLLFSGSSSTQSTLLPALTESQTKEVMSEILNATKLAAPKLVAMGQQVQQQYKMQGQELDDDTITKYILHPQFTSFLKETQEKSFEKFSVDEDEMEDAVNFYTKPDGSGDSDLIDMRNSLRLLYKQFGGEVEDEESEALTAATATALAGEWDEARIVAVVNALKTAVLQATDEFVGKFVEENGKPTSHAQIEAFQMGMMAIQERIEKDQLSAVGLEPMLFQQLLMNHQHSSELQMAFMTMQMESSQVLSKHGIKP